MCIAGLLDAMRSKLPTSARIVWMCLENHADDNRRWSMSLDRIVAEVNLSLETVVRAVRILQSHAIVRGERNGPGRHATVWHMLRSYDPSAHNGGIEPEPSPQAEGINGEEYPHNEGIKQPGTPQTDGIEMRGSPQNAGISIPAKTERLTHQVSNPPKIDRHPNPHGKPRGDECVSEMVPKNSRMHGTNPRALGTNLRAFGGNPRAEHHRFHEFWNLYPRAVARPRAVAAFNAALARGATADEIITGVARHRFPDDPRYCVMPAKWLNDERWKDELTQPYDPVLAAVGLIPNKGRLQ